MTRAKGIKNIKAEDRLKMCEIIAPRLKFRDTNKELLMRLEDNGFDVSEQILMDIKVQLRTNLKDRFKAIGEYELAEEHDYAIQMMKFLMTKMKDSLNMCDGESERVRVVAQMQSIQKDLIDYYGSSDIVENVFKYFNQEEEEKEIKKVTEIRERVVKKKQLNKTKKKKMMTEF